MAITTPYSTIELLRGAFALKGYSIEQFELTRHGYTRFIAPNGNSWLTADAQIIYPFPSTSARHISINKDLAYEFAERQGMPTPKTFRVPFGKVDAQFLAEMLEAAPLVVKPNDSTLSRGLTMHVTKKEQLLAAITFARDYSDTVLVQQYVEGEEVRFAVINGKIVAAVLRQRLRVTGDGVSTIAQLVVGENKVRSLLDTTYFPYPQITEAVVPIAGDRLLEVPEAGEIVVLGQSSMVKRGSSLYNITEYVHESYRTAVEKLTVPFGKGFVVVDMLIADYAQPKTDKNCSFMEFNMAPVLNHFYNCRDGKRYDIVADLAEMIDAMLMGRHT